jgi:hypothetical protein
MISLIKLTDYFVNWYNKFHKKMIKSVFFYYELYNDLIYNVF